MEPLNMNRTPEDRMSRRLFPKTDIAGRLVPPVAAWMVLISLWLALAAGAPLAWAADWPAGPSEVRRATLSNGLQVVVVRNPSTAVVTTVVNYRAGYNEAPTGFPGMAHAQGHMMSRGSPGLTAGQLADINTALGGRFDADTQQTVTPYFSPFRHNTWICPWTNPPGLPGTLWN